MIKKLGKDIVIYGGGDFLFKLIGFAVFPIYSHLFSVSDFGVMALLAASSGLVGVFINLGVNNAIQRFYWDPATKQEDQAVLVSTGLFQLVISGVLVSCVLLGILSTQREFIAHGYGIKWSVLVFAVSAILPDQILQFVLDAIRLHFTPVRFLIVSFFKNLLGVGLGLWLVVKMRHGLDGVFAGMLLASAAALPLAFWFIRTDLTLRFSKEIGWKLFKYGYPFVFAGVAYWVFSAMDRWMLAQLSLPIEVGLYSIAFKFAGIVIFITSAFGQAWSPYAIRILRDDPNYRQTYSGILTIWFFILAMIVLAISLFAGELLMVLTPPAYWNASKIMIIVTIGTAIFGTTQITAIGISLEKRTPLLTVGAALAAVINFGLNLVLIPRYGAIGAAVATLFSYSVLTALFLYWTQQLHPIPLEKAKLLYSMVILVLSLFSIGIISENRLDIGEIIGKFMFLLFIFLGALVMGIIDRKLVNSFFIAKV